MIFRSILALITLGWAIGLSAQSTLSFSVQMKEAGMQPLMVEVAMMGGILAVQLPLEEGKPASRLLLDKQRDMITLLVKDGNIKTGYSLPTHMASLMAMMMTKDNTGGSTLQQAQALNRQSLQFSSTGKKKQLEGKSCDQFIATWDNKKVSVWTTTDMPITIEEFLAPISGLLQSTGLNNLTKLNGANGFPLLMEYFGESGEVEQSISIKNISENSRPELFNTAGYRITEMK